ncbi:MAG: hypothetical protein AB7U18_01085 [Dehalococcoidia bacterium]
MSEVTNAGQQVLILLLALGGALGISWVAGLKRVYGSVFGKEGYFARQDQRFDRIEQHQEEAKTRSVEIAKKVDTVITEQKDMRREVKDIRDGQYSDRERIARLEGRRDAQLEAAQLANAVGNVANAITHPREATPHETPG